MLCGMSLAVVTGGKSLHMCVRETHAQGLSKPTHIRCTLSLGDRTPHRVGKRENYGATRPVGTTGSPGT